MNKTKQASLLGISRPTLYKRLKNGEIIIDNKVELQKECIKLTALHNSVSPEIIESILEFLSDNKFLSQEGLKFRKNYWTIFIKE